MQFFKKMKKKPEQLEVLENIGQYSHDDIDKLPSNHFPKWIKTILKDLSERDGVYPDDEAYRIAALMTAASQDKRP